MSDHDEQDDGAEVVTKFVRAGDALRDGQVAIREDDDQHPDGTAIVIKGHPIRGMDEVFSTDLVNTKIDAGELREVDARTYARFKKSADDLAAKKALTSSKPAREHLDANVTPNTQGQIDELRSMYQALTLQQDKLADGLNDVTNTVRDLINELDGDGDEDTGEGKDGVTEAPTTESAPATVNTQPPAANTATRANARTTAPKASS